MGFNTYRVDGNQSEIVQALRRIGCQVYIIKLPVDLLVSGGPLKERNVLLEVKAIGEKATAAQEQFWLRWPGEKHFVRSPEEAVFVVCGKELMR